MNDFWIAWLAGLFEGEGTASRTNKLAITQKKIWLIHRLVDLFGGSFHRFKNDGRYYYRWRVTGQEAKKLLLLITPLLSPHKMAQVELATKSARMTKKGGQLEI